MMFTDMPQHSLEQCFQNLLEARTTAAPA